MIPMLDGPPATIFKTAVICMMCYLLVHLLVRIQLPLFSVPTILLQIFATEVLKLYKLQTRLLQA